MVEVLKMGQIWIYFEVDHTKVFDGLIVGYERRRGGNRTIQLTKFKMIYENQ